MEAIIRTRIKRQREAPQQVEQSAHALVNAHPHFHGRAAQFEFVCREEVLVVRGLVPTFYLKQVLQTVLKDLDGVRLIDNRVTVTSLDGLSGILRD
jgi:hypothetical protein